MKKWMMLLVLFLCGCGEKQDIPIYGLVVENSSGNTITKTTVKFQNFSSGGGIVIPGTHSSYFPVDRPLPEQVTIYWMDSGNSIHQVPVAVKSKLPQQFSGDLIFSVKDGENVEFRYTEKDFTKYHPK